MREDEPPRLAGALLDPPRHVCAFFNSEDEEYRVLLPFIKDGFAVGHKAVHVVSPDRHDQHVDRLIAAGIDAADARRRGQLDIRSSTGAYLHGGRFNQDRMLQTFEKIASRREAIFPANRIVCQMEWAADHPSCIHDVIEFEARVNHLWSRHGDTVVCVYDLAKFSSDAVLDVTRTHPLIIVGGVIQRNPFFVPPDVFLRELRDRQPRSCACACAS
ncbi:MEDS domain-containing protein [Enterovirga sp. CN4-39]|uniref:MEDS domain-containing protein n=1 Tax=Enterovirga sp. CN4-39 TaxID=3400910 RepID=UPI003BFEB829